MKEESMSTNPQNIESSPNNHTKVHKIEMRRDTRMSDFTHRYVGMHKGLFKLQQRVLEQH